MRQKSNSFNGQNGADSPDNQPCVKAIRNANLNPKLKKELIAFIKRNTISDCGRVSPNCLKAHMISSAKSFDLPEDRIKYLKTLFKSRIGYKGYYLDNGKLKRV